MLLDCPASPKKKKTKPKGPASYFSSRQYGRMLSLASGCDILARQNTSRKPDLDVRTIAFQFLLLLTTKSDSWAVSPYSFAWWEQLKG